MNEKWYLCIDLKSFYASVECVERNLDPMTTDLVVADPERTDKTICLAVSPSMKEKGVKNRCRVFEIPKSIDYIMAPPRMQKYIDYAAEIYRIYLRYVSQDDIYVYSIDEVFMDITPYLNVYKKTPREMAIMLMDKVYKEIGVRATAGIGTNLYLAKIALDITAKHSPDFIGILDEESYRETLWDHKPITDFWRIGSGTERRLSESGIMTMRQIAHADEDMLYNKFGIDAELLIDHAWGREPVTISDIKKYQPKSRSLTSGQVLMRDYEHDEARLVLSEMLDQLCLDMTAKKVLASSVTVSVRFSNKSGMLPQSATGSFGSPSNVNSVIAPAVLKAFDEQIDRHALIRGFIVSCNNIVEEGENLQMSLFDSMPDEETEKDKKIQQAMLDIKDKYGKNAMFKGQDLMEGATQLERNRQIGGHKSGE